MTRRGVMRATAVGIGVAAGIGAIGSTATPAAAVDWSDVGTIAASTVVGGPVGLGWALRETEVLGADAPAEGLTGDVLKQEVYESTRKRESNNASTFVDNQNILDGVKHNAYTEAKVAAIEELNAGSTEQAVLDAANAAIDSYEDSIIKNQISSWNETVKEWRNLMSSIIGHPDFDASGGNQSPIGTPIGILEFDITSEQGHRWEIRDSDVTSDNTVTYTSTAGTEMTVHHPSVAFEVRDDTNGYWSGYATVTWSPLDDNPIDRQTGVNGQTGTFNTGESVVNYDGNTTSVLARAGWNSLLRETETTFQNVRSGIGTWVTNVYGDVQSGSIEISDLITPRERAAMLSEEETEAQAIADLAALNIPVDSEREATVTISETGATLSGTLGLTDSSDGPIESGTTYDPSTFAGDVYLTADVSQITGRWDAFQSGVDGGTITLTSEPYEGVILDVTTTAGETVSIPASDWTDNGDGTWSYDASTDLETTITEVDSVAYASADSETQYETVNLSKPFTIDKITNRQTGEEADTASFESSEPQTDSNYITQEEWNNLEQQNQELIDKYEESQSDGGGGGGGGFLPEDTNYGLLAAGAGALAIGWGYVTGDDQ
ncbi:hypothetical protein DJ71_15235 [Halorubrum sp. E3]|nr:hypothetical protein DJ71_15235 [Halorubrum sp. E3]